MAEYTTPEERAAKLHEDMKDVLDPTYYTVITKATAQAIRAAEAALLRELLAGGYVRHRAGLSAIRNRLNAT